jgi:hypothetical protein
MTYTVYCALESYYANMGRSIQILGEQSFIQNTVLKEKILKDGFAISSTRRPLLIA